MLVYKMGESKMVSWWELDKSVRDTLDGEWQSKGAMNPWKNFQTDTGLRYYHKAADESIAAYSQVAEEWEWDDYKQRAKWNKFVLESYGGGHSMKRKPVKRRKTKRRLTKRRKTKRRKTKRKKTRRR
jgi:hypothetical protein